MNSTMQMVIEQLIRDGKEFQVNLRGMLQPFGPGKVERRVITTDGTGVYFRMLVPAVMQLTKSSPPQNIFMPVNFAPEDVVCVNETPINADGDKAILTSGGKTPGGLHIPGSQ